MSVFRRLVGLLVGLRMMIGWQGLMIAVITLFSFTFGLGMLIEESQRPHQTRREVLLSILTNWMRAPDYLGLNLLDYGTRWRSHPGEAELSLVRDSLQKLGEDLELHDSQFPLITIVGLDLVARDSTLAEWRPRYVDRVPPSAETESIVIADGTQGDPLTLNVTYQVSQAVSSVFLANERYNDRLIEALIGLSGCSFLCFGYMVLYVQELRERVAREAAREATLDLADRTCHELGNVAFVVANERRNLSSHIDLLERFIGEAAEAFACAAKRAGLDATSTARLEHALRREYSNRRIDPAFELQRSTEMAREICRQIAVCSDYITLTVRELDGYLKQSLTHEPTGVCIAPVSSTELFEEALALLSPRIDAADAKIERAYERSAELTLFVDRRLMVHVLVNLIKNSIEASAINGLDPRITLDAHRSDREGVLQVDDKGPGMPSEVLERVFEDGFSTKGAGRGRGLAIVRESVQVQRGSIAVTSRPGVGTEFRISVPCSVCEGFSSERSELITKGVGS